MNDAPADLATRKQRTHMLLLKGNIAEATSAGGDGTDIWRELGGDLIAQGHAELGLYCRRRAVELQPDNVQLRKELIRDFLLLGRAKDVHRADADLAQPWRELGGELIAEGKLEFGLLCRRKAVELAPGNMEIRKEMIRDLVLAGRVDEACAEDGGLTQPWRELGGELIARGKLDIGLLCRRKAVELAPEDVEIRSELIRDLILAGQEAHAEDGGLIQVWRRLGGEFIAEGKLELGLNCRRKAVELAPEEAETRSELIRDLILAGRLEEAHAEDGGLAQVWRQLGGEFIAEGKLELGLNCRRWAVDASPEDPQLRLELVKELLLADPTNLQLLDSPEDALALRVLAAEPIRTGDIDTGAAYLTRALELDTDNHEIQEDVIRLHLATRRPEKALEVGETLDARKIGKTYDRRYYKDFTAKEKVILVEASQITLASPEAIIELIRGIDYILENKIPGAFIECGVFEGGNAISMIRTLLYAGVTDRDIYLYDTFEGFPKPEEIDYEYFVGPALETWQRYKNRDDASEDNSDWLRVPIERVRDRIHALGYPAERVHLVKGLVENTIPNEAPANIALLRLDTDFYRSTKHELTELFPRLQEGGILIIDDYGALHGARVATDEYFAEHQIKFFLARVDEHVRIGVKI
jgi:O-methyltransferase